jgi:hypothetical protein
MNEPLEKALIKAREKLLSSVMNEAQVSQGPVRSTLRASRSVNILLIPTPPTTQCSSVRRPCASLKPRKTVFAWPRK